MVSRQRGVGLLLVLLTLTVTGCIRWLPPPFALPGAGFTTVRPAPPVEQTVFSVALPDPLADSWAEFSGLSWSGDQLILLPQFPARFDNQLFALDQQEIVDYLMGRRNEPPNPRFILLDDWAVQSQISGSEGYEAIAIRDNRVYMTIESRQRTGMMGYLVSGELAPDLSTLTLDGTTITPIVPQSSLSNLSDEAIVLLGNQVVTFYEANGFLVNFNPVAHLFAAATLAPVGELPLPHIEYRVTDATAADAEGRFWLFNYFYPGDSNLLPFVRRLGGVVPTGNEARPVERLLEFQVTPTGIVRTDTPALPLQLLPNNVARNWEGVVRLQTAELNGFLIVTDSFPETILAYVGLP